MSKASELIEIMEQECGCRVDDNGFDNMAMAGLFGALTRALGQSDHRERDDVAAGVLIRHQMTPEYAEKKAADELLANMLLAGVSPDNIKKITG